MAKRNVARTTESNKIDQVIDRLETFMEICVRTKDLENEERLMGQITAFGVAICLLRQVKKRGELWTGGYLDNVGVVYTDQVVDFLENLRAADEVI